MVNDEFDFPEIISVPGKTYNLNFDIPKSINRINSIVPGNIEAKERLLVAIKRAYLLSDSFAYEPTALLLNGDYGIGKSYLVKAIQKTQSIPVIRIDLESLVKQETFSDPNFFRLKMLHELHVPLSGKDLSTLLKKRYATGDHNPKSDDDTVFLKELDNAKFAIVELDNFEMLSWANSETKTSATVLQSLLVDLVKNPINLIPTIYDGLTTKNFTYVFSANLNKLLNLHNVGFHQKRHAVVKQDFSIKALEGIDFSKSIVDLLSNSVTMTNLHVADFKKYLSSKRSPFQQELRKLNDYNLDIRLTKSAMHTLAEYLLVKQNNLTPLPDVTRKLLRPYFSSSPCKKMTVVAITPDLIRERLDYHEDNSKLYKT